MNTLNDIYCHKYFMMGLIAVFGNSILQEVIYIYLDNFNLEYSETKYLAYTI